MITRFKNLELIDEDGHYHVPDSELVQIASDLLEAFNKAYPRFIRDKRIMVSNKNLIYFYKAAELARELKETPSQYVEIQLRAMSEYQLFYVTAFANRDMHIKANTNNVTIDHVRFYKAQLELFKERVLLYGPRSAIMDESNQFTPLFRCIMANIHGFNDLVNIHKKLAIDELASRPIAQSAFGDLLTFLKDK